MKKQNHYDVLGVLKNASLEQIKRAYYEKAHKYHPDKNPGSKAAEEKFKDIAEAYSILSKKKTRLLYDQCATNPSQECDFCTTSSPGIWERIKKYWEHFTQFILIVFIIVGIWGILCDGWHNTGGYRSRPRGYHSKYYHSKPPSKPASKPKSCTCKRRLSVRR